MTVLMMLVMLLSLVLVRNFMRLRPTFSSGMLVACVTLVLCRTALLLLSIMIRLAFRVVRLMLIVCRLGTLRVRVLLVGV